MMDIDGSPHFEYEEEETDRKPSADNDDDDNRKPSADDDDDNNRKPSADDDDDDNREPSADDDEDPSADDNGLTLRPLCVRNCLKAAGCFHNHDKVSLNKVGDFVAFPSLWYHSGFYSIQSEGTVIFQAQLFATPSSGILDEARSVRRNTMTSHKTGNFCNEQQTSLEPLVHDLLYHWDTKYSAEKFPPSSKFQLSTQLAQSKELRAANARGGCVLKPAAARRKK
jgi:hypothetical protein